jgi:hypothetical protein
VEVYGHISVPYVINLLLTPRPRDARPGVDSVKRYRFGVSALGIRAYHGICQINARTDSPATTTILLSRRRCYPCNSADSHRRGSLNSGEATSRARGKSIRASETMRAGRGCIATTRSANRIASPTVRAGGKLRLGVGAWFRGQGFRGSGRDLPRCRPEVLTSPWAAAVRDGERS